MIVLITSWYFMDMVLSRIDNRLHSILPVSSFFSIVYIVSLKIPTGIPSSLIITNAESFMIVFIDSPFLR